jgi:hypothetical protein
MLFVVDAEADHVRRTDRRQKLYGSRIDGVGFRPQAVKGISGAGIQPLVFDDTVKNLFLEQKSDNSHRASSSAGTVKKGSGA